ncbi:MAG: hypothetical protein R3E88_20040 [Myxococcota bacterium]|nr:hypothetical protein [Myxococcales bacterium]
MNVESGFQLDLAGALRRRGVMIAATAGLIFLVGFWIAMALPNEYRAYATLLVQPQTVDQGLVKTTGAETDLNDRLHLMSAQILSRPRLSRVIDDLALYEDESRSMTRDEVIDLMRDKVAVVPVLPELEATLRTRRDIEINTFRVEFASGDARVAANVAQRLANDFIQEHISERVQVSQKSLDFIAAEQERLAKQIADVEARIAEVKDANPGSLPEDMMQTQRLIERAHEAKRVAQRDLDTARSDEAFWGNQARASDGGSEDVSPGRRLQQLELALDALRARGFTEKHPDVIVTLQEIAEVKESIRQDAARGAPAEGEPKTATQRGALAQQQRAQTRIQTAELEIERLDSTIADLQKQLEATPRVAEQLEALTRSHHSLSQQLGDFNNRRLEAEVRANLERRQLAEQFRVIEPAFPPMQPSAPNRIVILVVALMIGMSLGVAAAVVAESADSSVHGPVQLQNEVGIPVLASIPAILLAPDIAARRRRWLRNLGVAAAITLFMMLGGVVSYFVVNGASGGAVVEADDEGAAKVRDRALDLLREPGARRGDRGGEAEPEL